jgi:hypothetical protein
MKFSEYVHCDGLGLAELVRRVDVAAAELLALALERADRVKVGNSSLFWKR